LDTLYILHIQIGCSLFLIFYILLFTSLISTTDQHGQKWIISSLILTSLHNLIHFVLFHNVLLILLFNDLAFLQFEFINVIDLIIKLFLFIDLSNGITCPFILFWFLVDSDRHELSGSIFILVWQPFSIILLVCEFTRLDIGFVFYVFGQFFQLGIEQGSWCSTPFRPSDVVLFNMWWIVLITHLLIL